jgi:hypothetical protein
MPAVQIHVSADLTVLKSMAALLSMVLEVTMHESPRMPDEKKWLLSEAWMSLRQARLNGKAPPGR